MDDELMRVFWALRRALHRQADRENDPPNVFSQGRTLADKAHVTVRGDLDLMEMARQIVADLRRHDRAPQLIERTAEATGRHIVDRLLKHVVAPATSQDWDT